MEIGLILCVVLGLGAVMAFGRMATGFAEMMSNSKKGRNV